MHKIVTYSALSACATVVALGYVAARLLAAADRKREEERLEARFMGIVFDANCQGRRWAD